MPRIVDARKSAVMKAAPRGRISRDPDGKIDPVQATANGNKQ